MVSKMIPTVVICGAAYGLLACSSGNSSGGGGGGDKYGNRQIDTANFKNSASEGDFKQKGDGVDEYFSDLGNVKNAFNASGAGNSIMASFMKLMDLGDADAAPIAEDCQTEYSNEETSNGEFLTVETTTCVTTAEDSLKTCVETIKKTWQDEIVSTSKSCASSQTETTNTTTTQPMGSASGQYLPSFDQVQDCEDAFANFESTYQGVKTEFDNVYGMLMSPNGLNLAGSGLTDAGELKKIDNDDKSAVTYKITAPEQAGLKASGTISGGANDTMLLIRQKLDVTFDMKQMMSGMPQGPHSGSTNQSDMLSMRMAILTDGTIAVDLTRKLIEQDIDMKMVIGIDKEAMTSTAKGRIAVSAGDEKFVTVKMDVGAIAGDKNMTANVDVETRLVDKNTLTFRAKINGDQAGEMSFDLVRSADGECAVTNEKNTMPQPQQSQDALAKK